MFGETDFLSLQMAPSGCVLTWPPLWVCGAEGGGRGAGKEGEREKKERERERECKPPYKGCRAVIFGFRCWMWSSGTKPGAMSGEQDRQVGVYHI